MVRARQPQCRVTLHPFDADQDILQRFVHSVAHMKLSGNVRRRNHNAVRRFVFVDFGIEASVFFPHMVDPVFDVGWIVDLFKFFGHRSVPFRLVLDGTQKTAPVREIIRDERCCFNTRGTTRVCGLTAPSTLCNGSTRSTLSRIRFGGNAHKRPSPVFRQATHTTAFLPAALSVLNVRVLLLFTAFLHILHIL